jgi:hypothetical protein
MIDALAFLIFAWVIVPKLPARLIAEIEYHLPGERMQVMLAQHKKQVRRRAKSIRRIRNAKFAKARA